ncbi:MAG: hypothetical protein AB7F59_13120 [Bdellovibrionales bacterium]
MDQDILCLGFKVKPSEIKEVEMQIADLLELCPSDSYLEANITKTHTPSENSFCMMAEIRYVGGAFIARGTASNLVDAVEKCIGQLYGQMHSWRKKRGLFKEYNEIEH